MDNIKGNVLVVDDNLENLRILIRMLTENGYKVRPAPNASLAMMAVKSTLPDLILLDIRMSDMNGYEMCQRLKAEEHTRDVPIIFISALDEPMDKVKAFEVGGVDYITKPFQIEDVLARVRTHITLRQIQQQLQQQNERLQQEISERTQIELALEKANQELEMRVEQRTREIAIVNEELFNEIEIRKKTEESLRESENRLKAIFNAVNAAIIITDAETRRIVEANPASLNLLGMSEEQVIGQEYHRVISPSQNNRELSSQLTERLENIEHILTMPDGRIVPTLQTITPVMIDGRKHFIDSFTDITELKKAEQERSQLEARLRHAYKMEAIGTLAGGIAHDFNNILFPIFGYAEITMELAPKDSKVYKNLGEILKAAQRAKELVQQILTFSRQCEQEHKHFKVQPIIKEALKMLRSIIPTSIEFKIDIDNSCGPIMGDPTQIHQIMMNLCTNAYHAMQHTGGVLEVSLKEIEIRPNDTTIGHLNIKAGKYLKLTISDTGHGMTRDVMERIFEPYFTTKEKGKGTGLGLSVVHGIVQSHHGKIIATSEPDKGTSFYIYLPLIELASSVESADALEPIKRGSERILLIDDEPDIVEMEKNLLEYLGYQVTSCTASLNALEIFKSQPDQFDLVITDMTMPVMTGDILSQKLRETRHDIPIILCTGFSELINKEKANALGIQELMMKPVTVNEFAHVIRKVMDKAP